MNIYEYMLHQPSIGNFSFFSDKQVVLNQYPLSIYEGEKKFYLVYDVGTHAMDLRYLEISEADAKAIPHYTKEQFADGW